MIIIWVTIGRKIIGLNQECKTRLCKIRMYLLIGIYLQKKSGDTLRNVYIMGRNLPKISSIRSNKINNKNLHCFYQATKAPRSQHWIQMVLAEETLDDGDFQKTFRMTRNSFNQLHALLGTYILTS